MKKIMFVCMAIVVLDSCRTPQVEVVREVHHEYHHTIDTVSRVDSVSEKETVVIREVDSATMAQYGIKMEDMQRAWLVQTNRLQREVERLRETKTDTVVKCDSIPVVVPVEIEAEKQLSWWQEGLMWAGGVGLLVLLLVIWLKIKPP